MAGEHGATSEIDDRLVAAGSSPVRAHYSQKWQRQHAETGGPV